MKKVKKTNKRERKKVKEGKEKNKRERKKVSFTRKELFLSHWEKNWADMHKSSDCTLTMSVNMV